MTDRSLTDFNILNQAIECFAQQSPSAIAMRQHEEKKVLGMLNFRLIMIRFLLFSAALVLIISLAIYAMAKKTLASYSGTFTIDKITDSIKII